MISTTATLHQKYDSTSGLVSYIIFQVQESFPFLEGQFVMIQTEIEGKIIKKPYSIASTAKDMMDKKQIAFVVKKASKNGMSHFLTQEIPLGEEVFIKGPVGHYTISPDTKNFLLISTGSGLSPNVGIFKHLVYESKNYQSIINIFGEKTKDDIVPEVYDLLTKHNQECVHSFFHLSREETLPSGFRSGYVQSSIDEALEIVGTDAACFICGKPEMVDQVKQLLMEAGVDSQHITFEKY